MVYPACATIPIPINIYHFSRPALHYGKDAVPQPSQHARAVHGRLPRSFKAHQLCVVTAANVFCRGLPTHTRP